MPTIYVSNEDLERISKFALAAKLPVEEAVSDALTEWMDMVGDFLIDVDNCYDA